MLGSYYKDIKQINEQLNYTSQNHITVDGYNLTYHTDDGDLIYKPTKTGELFHVSNADVRLILGPFGSGKTTACLNEVVIRAVSMPHSPDGIRRSKFAVIRNTTGELMSTTLESWFKWSTGLGIINHHQKPNLEYTHTFNDGHGVVELRLIFLPLDLENARRKLLSLELTGAYLNELSELRSYILSDLKGRIGRYPWPEGEGEPYWTGIIADTNPPPEESWIYDMFEKQKIEQHNLFKQPAGLIEHEDGTYEPNIFADNYERLGNKYYMRMTHGTSKEWIKVYCMGQWGIVSHDKPVYKTYNDDIHSSHEIKPVEEVPLVLGFDFGRTPACVVEQMLPSGQLIMLNEFTSDNTGLEDFLDNIVMPYLNKHFNGYEIEMVTCDPSGSKKNDTDEKSCIEVLDKYFTQEIVKPAWSNSIARRLASVEYTLNRLVDGNPAFVLNRRNCNVIRKGFIGKYCYKKVLRRDGDAYTEVPDKNEFSHPHDAHQYVCMMLFESYVKSQGQASTSYEEVKGFRLVNDGYYRRK
jgi:hypothetical protein